MVRHFGFFFLLVFCSVSRASDFYVGKASVDISPKLPIALMGQFHLRIAESAETPLFANIVALESRSGKRSLESVVFVSCDLLYIPNSLRTMVRVAVNKRLPLLDTSKIILSATHTHTAPVLEEEPGQYSFMYPIPQNGVTQVKAYVSFVVSQITDGIVAAWTSKQKGSVAWGVERAVIGYNRRSVYQDGTSVLYGKTDDAGFRNLEGYENHDVNTMFFWGGEEKLSAVIVEVACPAQEVESRTAVNADYWHPLREALKKQYGQELVVIPWNGASGDLSPHRMYRKAAVERMNQLRAINALEDIAQRIAHAVNQTYNAVKNDRHTSPVLNHKAEVLELPYRPISLQEYQVAQKEHKEAAAAIQKDPAKAAGLLAKATWHKGVVNRYAYLQKYPDAALSSEVHVLRIGDIAVSTNQFELFVDYSIRIQARSKALQTFVVQLAGAGTYLATGKAIHGGGYSAICESNIVGEKGGQLLVDKTVEMINEMW